ARARAGRTGPALARAITVGLRYWRGIIVQNPYAPPGDFGLLPGALPAPGGAPRGFATREVLEAAWAVTKIHWPVLVAAYAVWTVPASLVSLIPLLAVALQLVEP